MKQLIFGIALTICSSAALAEDLVVAVASNFLTTLQQLAPDFENQSGHKVKVVSGSTGKLYAQIKAGAPFDVFLAARGKEVQLLEQDGLVQSGSRITYARGRLVLWSTTNPNVAVDGAAAMKSGELSVLAMANPAVAPFGVAAVEALHSHGIDAPYRFRVVRAEDVAQAFLYANSKNVDAAFVAESQIVAAQSQISGYMWRVPASDYQPIEQQAGVVARSKNKMLAYAFLQYLQSAKTKQRLQSLGYDVAK